MDVTPGSASSQVALAINYRSSGHGTKEFSRLKKPVPGFQYPE